MMKTDVKKGFFAKLQLTRSESIYRLLSKSSQPLSLYGEDVLNIRDYLYTFAIDVKESRKRRSKALASLLFLAVSKGSFQDMLLVFHAILSFAPDNNPLSADDSEEGGIFLRPEVVKTLEKFRYDTLEIKKNFNVKIVHSESKYDPEQILKAQQFSCPSNLKKPVSTRQLFVYLLAHLDILSTAYSYVGVSNLKLEMLNIHFLVEATPTTFENLILLIEKLVKVKESPKDEARIYSILAALRLLKLNIESLTMWKRKDESTNSLAMRTVHGKVNWEGDNNFFVRVKDYLKSLLEEQEVKKDIKEEEKEEKKEEILEVKKEDEEKILLKVMSKKETTKEQPLVKSEDMKQDFEDDDFVVISNNTLNENNLISIEISSILAIGFSLFYSEEDQKIFILDVLKNITHPFKYKILKNIIERTLKDQNYFDAFWIKGFEKNGKNLSFIEKIISFLKNYTSFNLVLDKLKVTETNTMILNLLRILLKWQNHLVSNIKFSDFINQKEQGAFLLGYSKILFENFVEILNESLSLKDQDLKHIDNVLHDSIGGFLVFPLIQSYIQMSWNKEFNSEVAQAISKELSHYFPIILKNVNKLNLSKSLKSEWFIAETRHPSGTFLDKTVQQDLSKNQDPVLGTSYFVDKKSNAPKIEVSNVTYIEPHSYKPKPGSTFFSTSDNISVNVNGDESSWGMKMGIFPVYSSHWLTEMEKEIAWLASKYSNSWINDTISEKESSLEGLDSPLLVNGLSKEEKRNSFISEIIEDKNEASKMIDFMYTYLKGETPQSSNQFILTSERTILLTLIYHSNLISNLLSMMENINQENFKPPSEFISIWRKARQIRPWMAQKKQNDNIEFQKSQQILTERCDFLLSFNTAGLDHGTVNLEVFNFITNDNIDVSTLRSIIKLRKIRATKRVQGLLMFNELLDSTKVQNVKSIILYSLNQVLRSKVLNFHFLNNVSHVGNQVYQEIFDLTFKLYEKILLDLNNPEDILYFDGFLKEVIDSLLLNFKPLDILWITELDFIKKLKPFIFVDYKREEDTLILKSFLKDEIIQTSLKSLTILKILALKISDCLENWETEKSMIHVEKQEKIEGLLNQNLQIIFDLFFKEFEKVKDQQSNITILCEILGLLCTLSTTPFFEERLKSEEFLEILSNILTINNPKILEYCLELSGKIISSGEKTSAKVKLFSQLLDYFGAQQMTYSLGKNIFKMATVSKGISKNVFYLIRKTIENQEWNDTFVSIFKTSLASSMEDLKQGILKNPNLLKLIFSILVIANGIKDVPQQGETVNVKLPNRTEESKVFNLEDNILSVRLEKTTKITQTYRIPLEKVRTKSDEPKPLNLENSDILFDFLDIIHQLQKSSKVELERLILSTVKLEVIKTIKSNNFKGRIDLLESIALEPCELFYGLEPRLNSCTICSTAEQFQRQSYFSCITCGMEKSKACCVFCARICHKGHNLTKVDVGDFYCDCGANTTKKKCESLGKQEPNIPMTKKRLQGMVKTLETLLPIAKIETKANENLYRTFNFKNGYSEKDGIITCDQSTFSMLGSSVVDLSQDFYFELTLEKFSSKDTICLGFTEKVNENRIWPDVLERSFTLNCCTGNLFKGNQILRVQFALGNNKNKDVFGLGYEEKEKQVFFTKNGQRINGNFPMATGESYPMIILKGDQPMVSVNFGKKPFEYKSIQSSKENKKVSNLGQLMELGYKESECNEALKKYPKDINAAMVWLSNLTIKPIRFQLADQLQSMGFEREDCLQALKLANDDLEDALQKLLEGKHLLKSDNEKNFNEDKGISLLGSDVSKTDLDSLVHKAMFINPNAKLNDEYYTNILIQDLKPNDIVTINPALPPNHPLYAFRGQICVFVGPYKGGAQIYVDDRRLERRFYSNVYEKDLTSFPMQINLKDLSSQMINLYNQLAIMETRKILYNILIKEEVDISTGSLYRIMKSLFLNQYDEQENSFVNSDIQLTPKNQRLIDSIKLKKVKGVPLMDYLSQEAIKEVVQFTDSKPHYRKIIFKSEYINSPQLVKFFNASNLYIHFLRCDLPTSAETLTLSYDKGGKIMIKQFKGPLVLQKSFVISGGQFYFEFKGNLREGSGFQFFVTPCSSSIPEELALSQPNIILSSIILQNTSPDFVKLKSIKSVYEYLLNYLMLPLAPFKGSIINTLSHITTSETIDHKPTLSLLKDFRFELEEIYHLFSKHYETSSQPFPNLHRSIDFISIIRKYLKSDICKTVLPNPSKKNHFYLSKKKDKSCSSCSLLSDGPLKYLDQETGKCEVSVCTNFSTFSQQNSTSNLVPFEKLLVNPSDWFEHTSWVDQVTITRQLIESLNNGKLPDWAVYEAALETKKKVIYKSSPHPYSIVKDSGEIKIPQANNLFISFDKHSKTHKCDKLIFYGKNHEELGRYSGDELKDKTILVHGNTVSYVFEAVGGDHDNTCNSCGVKISGIRFRCTECDDYDLCNSCMKKPRIHNETHLMLKIRRPVDCVPAALHHLYTIKWMEGYQFRGNIHVNVKCNGCGMNPIRGIRYWCENCEDYNLCEKCGEEEYNHHDRMHVFLRVVRPLPPKNERPSNHLPYGLVYEKELDTHWGYLFSVSSSESNMSFEDNSLKEVQEAMKGFNSEADSQLIDYIENNCNGWQSLEWNGFNISQKELVNYPKLNDFSQNSLRYRFVVLKLLNRKISKIIHLLDLSIQQKTSLGNLISNIREKIFKSVKMDVWVHSISKSVVETNPLPLLLSRQKDNITPKNTLFLQTFSQLEPKNTRFLQRKNGAWKVTFVGESADDYGGPFRESLTSICLELESDLMDVMIPVPNSKVDGGMNGEKFIPNPNSNINPHLRFYNFLGKILAVGLLNNNVLPFNLPSLFWKRIVGENISINDLKLIDTEFVNSLEKLENIDQEGIDETTFDDIIFNTFSILATDGMNCELIKNGKDIKVSFENRKDYVKKSFEFKLKESEYQIEMIKKGLFSILPCRYISILKWNELELLICGSPNIDLTVLKKHTIYDGYNQNSIEIINFWSILEEFSQIERSNYLKFVWGRARLPITNDGFTHPMKIQKFNKKNPDKYLPLSHTCFFSIELPPYSSKKVMKEKLSYAITHCKAIDIDVTNSANESRNMNVNL